MNNKNTLFGLIFLVLLNAPLVYAENAADSAWYLLPGVTQTWTDSSLKADDGLGGSLKIGKQINPNWDIQLGATYSRFDEDNAAVSGGKYKQTLLGFDALYMLSRENFRPFFLVGLGYARNDVDYNNNWGSLKNSLMANVGVGAQYFFNDRFGFQADLREVWSRAEVGPANNRDNEIIGNTMLSLGIIFKLDAPAPAPVVAAAPAPVAPVVESKPEPVAPAVEEKPAPPAPVCKPKTETITLQAETMFDFDKSVLKPEGKTILDQLIPKLKDHNDIEMVLVTGHTDKIGAESYNLALSKRRAEVVAKYLIDNGVDSQHIKAIGKGESEPEVECKGIKGKKLIECLAPNRRVVIDASHVQQAGCE